MAQCFVIEQNGFTLSITESEVTNALLKQGGLVTEESVAMYLKQKMDEYIRSKTPVVVNTSEAETNSRALESYTSFNEVTSYSGAADGADKKWEQEGKSRGLKHVNYVVDTLSKLTPEQQREVENAYQQAVKDLGRRSLPYDWQNPNAVGADGKKLYYSGGLVRRDYLQAKAGDAVFGIIEGFDISKGKSLPKGGTGYAVVMATALNKPVYLFDQSDSKWYDYNKGNPIEIETPVLTKKATLVGTRKIKQNGIDAIKAVFDKTAEFLQSSSRERLNENASESTQIPEGLKNTKPSYSFTYKGKSIPTEFQLSQDQEKALKQLIDFVQAPNSRSQIVLQGAAGCLGFGTKVLMFDGSFKEVQDVEVGDQLMGIDSTPRTVQELKRGVEQMYWVHQTKGQSYRVNENHILSLKEVKSAKYSRKTINGKRYDNKDIVNREKTINTVNIKLSEYLITKGNLKKQGKGYQAEAIEFSKKDLIIDPYYLGLWLGDGNTDNIRTITNVDNEIINYLLTFGIRRKHKITYTIEHKTLKDDFKELYGLSNANSLNEKYIPQQYLTSTIEDRLQLLAGLLDSDGHYSKVGKYYEICSKHKKLADQIEYLGRSLGFKVSKTTKIIRNDKFKKEEYVNYRLTLIVDKEIPCKVHHKKNEVRTQIKNLRHTGIKIEKDIVDNYYGFTLDGDNLFMLEDFTVTHNTGKTSIIGYLQKYLNEQFLYTAPTHAATVELAFATAKTGNRIMPITVASSMNFSKSTKTNVLSRKASKKIGFGRVIVSDELSMLNNKDYIRLQDLAKQGYLLIYLGDKKQIPEVSKSNNATKNISAAFTDNEIINLDVIHRTSNEEIKSVLQKVRDSPTFQLYKPENNTTNLQFLKQELEFKRKLRDFVVQDPQNTDYIAYTNDAVSAMNKLIREQIFNRSGLLKEGDIVMGYLGYASKQVETSSILNSVSFKVESILKDKTTYVIQASSERLDKLSKLGFSELPKNYVSTLIPLGKNEAFENDLTQEELDKNNKDVSHLFIYLHNKLSEALNTNQWGGYISAKSDVDGFFSQSDLMADYIYDVEAHKMIPFDKSPEQYSKYSAMYGNNMEDFVVEKGIDFGHAITIHKSQGRTTRNVFFDANTLIQRDVAILENGKQISTERQSLSYVGLSRASENLFVNEGWVSFTEIKNVTSKNTSTPETPQQEVDNALEDLTC